MAGSDNRSPGEREKKELLKEAEEIRRKSEASQKAHNAKVKAANEAREKDA
jgi:hypothetical protein